MWWDVGWVTWGQDAARGFLAPGEQVRTAFPAWHYLGRGVETTRQDLVVLLTDRDVYVLREGGSSRSLNYGQVLFQLHSGSFVAQIGKSGRHRYLWIDAIDGHGIYFKKDQVDGAREVVAAGTEASTRGQEHT
jgi:hypothetical protein